MKELSELLKAHYVACIEKEAIPFFKGLANYVKFIKDTNDTRKETDQLVQIHKEKTENLRIIYEKSYEDLIAFKDLFFRKVIDNPEVMILVQEQIQELNKVRNPNIYSPLSDLEDIYRVLVDVCDLLREKNFLDRIVETISSVLGNVRLEDYFIRSDDRIVQMYASIKPYILAKELLNHTYRIEHWGEWNRLLLIECGVSGDYSLPEKQDEFFTCDQIGSARLIFIVSNILRSANSSLGKADANVVKNIKDDLQQFHNYLLKKLQAPSPPAEQSQNVQPGIRKKLLKEGLYFVEDQEGRIFLEFQGKVNKRPLSRNKAPYCFALAWLEYDDAEDRIPLALFNECCEKKIKNFTKSYTVVDFGSSTANPLRSFGRHHSKNDIEIKVEAKAESIENQFLYMA
jgi:hypothetical protein